MAITTTTTQQAFLQETSQVYLVLLTISQADVTTLRVVNNNEAITSNGNLFTAFPFDIHLPDMKENSPPRAQLTIDNTSREIAQAIRNMTSPATILIEVIRAADPDTIEKTYSVFTMRNVEWNASRVTADLLLEDIEVEPFPVGEFNPAQFGGLF